MVVLTWCRWRVLTHSCVGGEFSQINTTRPAASRLAGLFTPVSLAGSTIPIEEIGEGPGVRLGRR